MGSCFSKKPTNPTSHFPQDSKKDDFLKHPSTDLKRDGLVEVDKSKKEIFLIKHRKSHEISHSSQEKTSEISTSPVSISPRICNPSSPANDIPAGGTVTASATAFSQPKRTSSCSKEEVDAILIQCGRLSRSSSGNGKVAASGGRNYSGSKRSYDFDNCDNDNEKNGEKDDSENRIRNRQSRGSPSPHGRRRTPSREREPQRSGSRDRVQSRSPARRRSENNHSNSSNRPGKIVTVPATVSSTSNNEVAAQGGTIKRVLVKRNVASPRSQSPAKANYANVEVLNEIQDAQLGNQHQPSLSRSSSRKEQSPYRRRPLNEISSNTTLQPQSNKTANAIVSQAPMVKPNVEATNNNTKVVEQKPNNCSRVTKNIEENKTVTMMSENTKVEQDHTKSIESRVIESFNPLTLTRSRSSRKSRDLDIEALSNHSNSYASVLLQDIQNFHQKSSTTTIPSSFALPPCLTKACSILEAVADLNSSIGSDRLSNSPLPPHSINKNYDVSTGTTIKTITKFGSSGDPFVESEVTLGDDLMVPSLHKYVTMRRGSTTSTAIGGEDDREEQESSGSNSFVGGGGYQQYWEPNSADSTDRSSKREAAAVASRRLSAKKKREYEPQQSRTEHNRVGGTASRSVNTVSAAGST